VYKIVDFDDEELKGTFYEQELQRVNKTDSDFIESKKYLDHACVINVKSIL
jgi:hypothetical protein